MLYLGRTDGGIILFDDMFGIKTHIRFGKEKDITFVFDTSDYEECFKGKKDWQTIGLFIKEDLNPTIYNIFYKLFSSYNNVIDKYPSKYVIQSLSKTKPVSLRRKLSQTTELLFPSDSQLIDEAPLLQLEGPNHLNKNHKNYISLSYSREDNYRPNVIHMMVNGSRFFRIVELYNESLMNLYKIANKKAEQAEEEYYKKIKK